MALSAIMFIVITLLLSAFFSGMEIAFISSNKLGIELSKQQGSFSGKIISWFDARPEKFIGAMLVGNNITLVVYGIGIAAMLDPILYSVWADRIFVLVAQTILATLLVLVFAEFLPKAIFRMDPNGSLKFFALPLLFFYLLLWLPMMLMIGISKKVLKLLMNVELEENKRVFGKVDLDDLVKDATNRNEHNAEVEQEIQIFQNALELADTKARECMVPRNEIVAVQIQDDISILKEKFIETGLSKILVYRDNIDNMIGYCHCFDLFKMPKNISSILLPIQIVPETMAANDILHLFIRKKWNIAVVVDEFGGTSGMLTIEDVVEEIVGEIKDEHDQDDLVEERINEREFKLSARFEVEYLNEKYDLDIPVDDDYDTLSGFILHNTEEIPKEGQSFRIGRFHITALKVLDNRIDVVRLELQVKE